VVWRRRFVLRDGGLTVLVVATVALVATVLTGGGGTSTLVSTATTGPGSPLPAVAPADGSSSPLTPAVPSRLPVSALPSASPTVTATSAVAVPGFPGPGLRLDLTARAAGSLVGETTVRVRDTDGAWNGGYITFGDGKRLEIGRSSPRCSTTAGKTAPSDVTRTFRHTYAGAGDYHVVVHVRTERLCSAAPVEEASRTVRVRISGQSAPTKSPAPTKTPSKSPAPTKSPSPRPTEQPSPDPTGPDPTPSEEPSPDPTPEQTTAARPR
jgi:hypothetical protein